MKLQKKTCMLIPQLVLPIPDVEGGAIETLITNLIEENEIENKVRFVVVSKYNEVAAQKKYKNTKIYYFKDNEYVGKGKYVLKILWYIYRLVFKLIQNRITHKLFGLNIHVVEYLTFQYILIAKKEKVSFVSIEADENEYELSVLNSIVGKENVYNHIHYTRKENIASRRLISNSINISEYVKNKWVQDQTIEGHNVVLYNGVDISTFENRISDEEYDKTRKDLNVKPTDTLVVFCGRILRVKGVSHLLDAFDMIDDKSIKLLVIGGKLKSEQDFADEMIARMSKMDNVTYLGYVSNNSLSKYYQSSDIQVIPSVWEEGAGLVAIEGMASGLPLVITQSGGMVEYVDDSCSVKIPIDDDLPDNLAKEILSLSKDKERMKLMGENGRRCATRFSKQQYYHDFVDIVNSKK